MAVVDIYKQTYEILKAKAQKNRLTVKEFVNQLLESNIKKFEFVTKAFPGLEIDAIEDTHVTLRNLIDRTYFDVYYKNKKLFCEQDKSFDCMHVQFVYLSPEFSHLVFDNHV